MIEYLKEYWRSRFLAELERRGITEEDWSNMSEEEWIAKGEEADQREKEAGAGRRQGFVLLEKAAFDYKKLICDLKTDWGFEIGEHELKDDNLVFHWGENLMAVSLLDMPVPDGEAEYFAEANYMWKEAVETTKRHQAHLLIFSINQDGDAIECAASFSKLVSSCINQKEVLGIYTGGNVYEPEFYQKVARVLKKKELPIPIWVYIGLISNEKGNSGYTYGMDLFGKSEMEIVESAHSLQEIQTFLYYVVDYVIKTNMMFKDGETMSFTSDERLTIIRSKAVYLDGESLKIGY